MLGYGQMRTASFTEGLNSVAEQIPAWLSKALGGKNDESLPSWLTLALEDDTIEEMTQEEEERAISKNSDSFTTQLMTLVRKTEAPRFGYNSWYGRGTNSGPIGPSKMPIQSTLSEVLAWGVAAQNLGTVSTAIGGYQIKHSTLKSLILEMGLTGDELYDEELQDRMGLVLAERRGLSKFLSRAIDGDTFAAGIAREWAAFPVLKEDKRGSTIIAIGQSYHRGVGSNKSLLGAKQLEEYRELYALADRSIGE